MSDMAAARAEAQQALREKRARQQGGPGSSAGGGSGMSSGDLSAIESFQAQKAAAGKRTNTLGQTEAGVPMWKVRLRPALPPAAGSASPAAVADATTRARSEPKQSRR
jgi:hypothetical protein